MLLIWASEWFISILFLFGPLSVIENIIVGTDAAHMFLKLSEAQKKVQKLCSDYDIALDLSAKIWQLSVAEQRWVEILKLGFGGVKLLISINQLVSPLRKPINYSQFYER